MPDKKPAGGSLYAGRKPAPESLYADPVTGNQSCRDREPVACTQKPGAVNGSREAKPIIIGLVVNTGSRKPLKVAAPIKIIRRYTALYGFILRYTALSGIAPDCPKTRFFIFCHQYIAGKMIFSQYIDDKPFS